jgi:predicted dehydrogenase
VAGSFLYLSDRARGANDRVTLALIGGQNQGKGDAVRSIQQGAQIATFCDLDEAILGKVGPILSQAQGKDPKLERDFRRVLDDKSIDAVIIATPDHWHTHIALQACQAGKDVYVEKPLSQTISEGHLIRDAARKYNRVMQVGMQRRTIEHFISATDYVASGALGKVCLVKAWMCQVRATIGNPPDQDPPRTVDYDAWLGPAPKRPFNRNRFHYTWRFFWDYGNSELGNQGVHMLDVALSGIQKMRKTEHCLPARIGGHGGIYWLQDAKEVPDTQVLTYDFGDLLLTWELRSFGDQDAIEGTRAGTGFYGTDGTLVVDGDGWKVYGKRGETVKVVKNSGGSHEKNFLDCVKSRKRPNADVETGRLSTTLCHLGNIAQHLGRSVRFDPQSETFGDDSAANALLTKQYRSAYPLPRV